MLRILVMWASPTGVDFVRLLFNSLKVEYCLLVGETESKPDNLEDSQIEYMYCAHPHVGQYQKYVNLEEITPIDEELILKMAPYESLMFRAMDFDLEFHPDGRHLRYGREYRTRYLKCVKYWNWFLEEKKINLFILPVCPHDRYDYVAYCLCKIKNIKCLIVNYTPISGMSCWTESWEEPSIRTQNLYLKMRQEYSCDTPIILSSFTEQHYQYQLSENPTPLYMNTAEHKKVTELMFSYEKNKALSVLSKDEDLKFTRHLNSLRNRLQLEIFFYELLIKFLRPLMSGKNTVSESMRDKNKIQAILGKIKEPDFLLRLLTLDFWIIRVLKNNLIASLRKHRKPQVEQRYNEVLTNLKRRQLFRFYDEHAVEPDLSQRYIYVALHYQPEMTTMPLAGAFVNQLLIIELLAYCIPKDVLLYVKEHPNQDWPCRSISFYESILKVPNVYLIRRDYNTFELSRHSIAVATATGTVGWEALFMQKPVLLFGTCFYQYASGVLKIKTLEDCQSAIYKIIHEGYKPSLYELKLFLKAMDETCFLGGSQEYQIELSGLSKEENLKNLWENLKQFLPPDVILP